MGCFFTNVTLSFSQDFWYNQDSIVAEASLLEDGTEIQVSACYKLFISEIGGMALFDDVNPHYHTGEMYRGKIYLPSKKMWTPFLLSCLGYTLRIVAQSQYLIILPAELSFPSSQRVCLDLRGVEKHIRVVLTLVPKPAGSQEVGTVQLHISNGQYFSVKEEKQVLIHWAGTGTFIQIEKPVYKPGQTVKFRIVTLTEDFVPVNNKDPHQNSIGQWLDVRPKQGIADLSFQLASELSLGTYTLNVVNPKASSTFKVEEHVLQKFDVFFEVPAQIYASDRTFLLSVCGRYSYGKAVKGTVWVTLCQKAKSCPQDASKDICREYSGLTASMGCFTSSVSTTVFNLAPSEKDSKIYAEASLLESGTGVQINTSRQIVISRTAASVVFETLNAYYIPGVPFRGKIKLQDHYGNGMKSRKVNLIIRFMKHRLIKTYITDGSGSVSFNLDTTAWNSSSVSLEGRFTLENVTQKPWKTSISYTNAYLQLQPFHVTTKSFLEIHPLTGKSPCGLKQNVQVTFTLNRADMGEDTTRIDFAYYVSKVTGKAGIVNRGWKSVQVGKLNNWMVKCAGVSPQLPEVTAPGQSANREGNGESNCTIWERRNSRTRETVKERGTGKNYEEMEYVGLENGGKGQTEQHFGFISSVLKGSFFIPLTFTADFTPSPCLVVYTIFPNGGATADSVYFDVALCFENEVKVDFPTKESHTGSIVELQLQAAPGSMCAVQAVDENVFLIRPESELTSQKVSGT
ncbi:hypothetical protein ASZ78_002126 [Callipepla squamata]|uniref:Alpha-2-macroglobulin bait region domain-containing protein n=1 Tax=Callipepla squamata TaxID=9009 RepID=A0A226MM22_CALSU|nr:hypothetical protein ASZ78_002126 [Callipepla squamata]